MKSLVVYYSLSGITRTVATVLAKDLTADIEELRCSRYAPGVWGYWRAVYDSLTANLPPIEPLAHALSQYELVVIATPVWASHPATPARTLMKQERLRLPRLAFVLTHGGAWGERSLREMEEIVGRAPIATLVVREQDVKEQRFASALSSFEARIRKTEAA